MSDDIAYGTIATTRDTNDPVMKVKKGESTMTFIIDSQAECVNVWHVESENDGDFKAMMDDLISSLKVNWVQFISPFGDQEKQVANEVYSRMGVEKEAGFEVGEDATHLSDVLDGFERVEEQHDGKTIPMLVGFWEPDR